jgi:phospholipase C
VITYDDSDGWYDHVLAPIVNGSQTSLDTLTNTGQCGNPKTVPQTSTGQPEQGRCGYGPRLPFLVVSPYARQNAVSSTLIDQSSVVKFIESNWSLPAMGNGAADVAAGSLDSLFNFNGDTAPALFLNPSTGEPAQNGADSGNS